MKSDTRQVLGRYRLGGIIGAGGMGTVVVASDELLGRQVALKLLRDDLADNPRALARFRQEARIAASLSHPGIAAVYDFAEDAGRQAIVMELLDGQDLHTILERDGPMEPVVAAGIVAEVAEALNYAHSMGAVHRDVKPANIFLTRSGTVKLTDFGVAHAGGMDQLTTTGMVIGTPDYLSPEQVRGEVSTPASDIYSLGAVAYQLLTGTPPFHGDNPIAVATARLGAPAPSPRSVNPRVSEALDAVVRRALDPLPRNRFASAGALAGALRGAAHARPGPVPGPVAFGRATPDPALGRDNAGRDNAGRDNAATGVLAPVAPRPYGTTQISASPPTLVELPVASRLAPELAAARDARLRSGRHGARARSRWRWLGVAVLIAAMVGISYDIVGTWVRYNQPHPVPAWSGLSYNAALHAAQGLGLVAQRVDVSSVQPVNQVLGTTPGPGTMLKRGARVSLQVSLGNEIPVPNVLSTNVKDAEATLRGQGLNPVVSTKTVPGTVAGQVADQEPVPSSAALKGSAVTLTVTAVPPPPKLPTFAPLPSGGTGGQTGTGNGNSNGNNAGGGVLNQILNLFGNPFKSPKPKQGGSG